MVLDLAGTDVDQAKLTTVLKQTSRRAWRPGRCRNGWRTSTPSWRPTRSRSAMYAILASWAVIALFLWFRFGNWTFGVATVLCLIHDLFFTLGCIAVCHYLVAWVPGLATVFGIEDFKIDLPAVAALLTLVGYSVSDTIVVFDRIREVRGKNPLLTPQMINDSVNQTLTPDAAGVVDGVAGGARAVHLGRRGRPPVRVRDGGRRDRRHLQLDLHRQPAAADLRRRHAEGERPASGRNPGGSHRLTGAWALTKKL